MINAGGGRATLASMLGWVAVTDYTWYQRLREEGFERGEVNFWQPSARAPKKHMPVGMPFFFKLHLERSYRAARSTA